MARLNRTDLFMTGKCCLGSVDLFTESGISKQVLASSSVQLPQVTLSKILLSLDGCEAKQQAVYHLLHTLRIMWAR
jgi:hypothetical protein